MKDKNNQIISEDDIERILRKVGPLVTPPEEMGSRIRENVKAEWRRETSRRRQWRNYRIAAVVCAVSFAMYFGAILMPDMNTAVVATLDTPIHLVERSADGVSWRTLASGELREGDYLRTAPGTSVSVTFENKMNVRLASASMMQIVTHNEVDLKQGAVYLDSINRVVDVPFVVVTDHGRAVDIGTQFIVSANPDAWSVQVREGQVNVSDGQTRLQLVPGDLVTISANDQIERSTVPAHDESWRWAEAVRPHYNLEGQKLSDYLSWVSRETGKTLRYTSLGVEESAAHIILRGSIDNLTAEESVQFVMRSTNLELIESAENVIMVGEPGS